MKVLWLSNKALSDHDYGNTATWLDAMALGLISPGGVELGNICMGFVQKITRMDYGPVRQWVVPCTVKINGNGLPSERMVTEIINAVTEFAPDLVHVWGTENYWGLLTARRLIQKAALLETQGFKSRIAGVFHGGLSYREQLACVGFKEILRRSTIWQGRKHYERWADFEKEIISGHDYIDVQTKWGESQVKAINRKGTTFDTALILREPFYEARQWQYSGKHQIFCSAAYPVPFKGLHIAVKAVAILKEILPDIRLRIAGALQRKGIRQDGYFAWINRQIIKLGIESNIEWLGALDGEEMVKEMSDASVMLIPTYMENCCTTMQEAMMIGTPVVSTYTGGLPDIARDEESALFFPVGDEVICAYQMERALTDKGLSIRLSQEARKIALARNDRKRVIERQMNIYRLVLDAGKQRQIGPL